MSTDAPTFDEIRAALQSNALIFYYQPKVSFLTGKITGARR